MSWFSFDVEADGPIPGPYSMVSIGSVIVRNGLKERFYSEIKPISEEWVPDALSVSGFTREETLNFPHEAEQVMIRLESWVKRNTVGRPMFIADNNGFDWMFVNWYFHRFIGRNPFGYSSQNIGSIYKGAVRDMRQNFKHLRRTTHTHNALDDAIGNAEALMTINNSFGLGMDFK